MSPRATRGDGHERNKQGGWDRCRHAVWRAARGALEALPGAGRHSQQRLPGAAGTRAVRLPASARYRLAVAATMSAVPEDVMREPQEPGAPRAGPRAEDS